MVKLHGRAPVVSQRTSKAYSVLQSEGSGTEPSAQLTAIAEIIDFTDKGGLVVKVDEVSFAVKMTATVGRFPQEKLLSREVLLLRCGEDWVALDVMEPEDPMARELMRQSEPVVDAGVIEATPDRLVLSALKHLELRVGKSSIVINDEGKITTRAERLLQWAKGAIRIKGGHVDIN